MNQESILQDQQDWHLRWLFRRMEEITERRAIGFKSRPRVWERTANNA